MFGLGLKRLEQFCHQLGLMLEAGVPLPRALNSLSSRGVAAGARPTVARIARDLDAGSSFTQALDHQGNVFPPLMRNLIRAGEESGNLDAVLKRLASYFELQRKIRNKFLMQLAYPALTVFVAICVMSLMSAIFITIQESETGSATSPTRAAARTFVTGMGIVGGVVFLYFLFTRILIEQRTVQEVLLRIPALGAVRRNTAIARFSWAMEMMLKAGMNIRDSLRRALESTSNGAFLARRQKVDEDIIGGESVSKALDNARLFPDDFMEVITVAEESGSMDDSFGRMARQYFDRAETAMRISTAVISWLIWGGVALLVAIVVISFYVRLYGGILSQNGMH